MVLNKLLKIFHKINKLIKAEHQILFGLQATCSSFHQIPKNYSNISMTYNSTSSFDHLNSSLVSFVFCTPLIISCALCGVQS